MRITREFEPDQQAILKALRVLLQSPVNGNVAGTGADPENVGDTSHPADPDCHSAADAASIVNDGASTDLPLSRGSSSPELA